MEKYEFILIFLYLSEFLSTFLDGWLQYFLLDSNISIDMKVLNVIWEIVGENTS